MRILMVCTGNTCRSPMAAALMKQALKVRGISNVEVDSAGVSAYPGDFASAEAIFEMSRRGLDLTNHRAKHVMDANVDGALVLCMTHGHQAALRRSLGIDADTIMQRANLSGDIPDPIGGDQQAYREAAGQMERAIEIIADSLQGR